MKAATLIVVLISAFTVCHAADTSALQRSADSQTRVGRTRLGFRIAAHRVDFAMKAPRGWRIALCTEEPLNAQVVCESPDKKSFVEVRVRTADRPENFSAPPEDYLRELRRFKDPKIVMTADEPLRLPDGRSVSVWRFSSQSFGQHLYTRLAEDRAVVDIEVSDTRVHAGVTKLRRILADILRSKRPHQAMERIAGKREFLYGSA